MAKSIIQSIWGNLGQSTDPEGSSSTAFEHRMEDVASLFTDLAAISSADSIDPEWCFRVELLDGKTFLVWTSLADLSGTSEDDEKTFCPDFEAAKLVTHPNIFTPLHITRVRSHAIVVTEDFDGKALFRETRGRKHSIDWVHQIFFQITGAVEAAHASGVLHRALCPSNIIIDADSNVKVFGFGMANIFFDRWDAAMENHRHKLIDYLAPEVANNGLFTTVPHCDGFSIGRIVYEMLVGQLPKNSIIVLPSTVAKVPPFVDDALLYAMHGDRNRRPQTVVEFREMFYGIRVRDTQSLKLEKLDGRKSRFAPFEGSLSWLNVIIFPLSIGLLVVTIGIMIAIFSDSSIEESDSAPFDALAGFETFKVEPEKLSNSDLKNLYQNDAKQFESEVDNTYEKLVSNDKYEEANLYLEKVGGVGNEEFDARILNRTNDINEYQEMITIAKSTRSRGDAIAENAALARAKEIFPNSKKVKELLNSNPRRIAARLTQALNTLRSTNPEQTEWHYHVLVTHNRVILDLTGHENLTNLSALRGQVIHELNLSRTGITSLLDLIGLPIEELRIDHTKISNLSEVAGLPLRIFTFTHTEVGDISPLNNMPYLRCMVGQNAGGPVSKIYPPDPDQVTWIDENQTKFRALPGMGVLMAEKEYPVQDGDIPITMLTFKDAENICSHLTVRHRKSNQIGEQHQYRLPTDGEWSFAVQLPESQFLSPKGRMLQQIDETAYLKHRRALTILEINKAADSSKHSHNGFLGIHNGIGEWVDHSRNRWDETCLVRGIARETEIDTLRERTRESSDVARKLIGFRPVLEIENNESKWDLSATSNSRELAGITLGAWETPHLSAAASSSILLSSLLKSEAYRSAYVGNSFEIDPFANRRYLRVDLPISWTEARSIAHQLGGSLAMVENRDHLIWLYHRFVEDNPLRTPLWMGASALAEKSDWEWVNDKKVPVSLTPANVDGDKRRGALLVPVRNSTPAMTATPVSERHSFLIAWDIDANGDPITNPIK